jgi:dihydropteroate synthase
MSSTLGVCASVVVANASRPTALAADRGADIVRVHDVAENRAAVDVAAAVNGTLRTGGADEANTADE